MRVLVYARQSVDKDDGERSLSLDSQVAVLTERCQREEWTIIATIRESGLRGWMDADERPGLGDAIARAEHGEYDVLLVWDLSRLARSVRLQEQWVWQFTRYGVEIVSHTEPESADALIRQIKGAVNEHRTKEIAAHMRRTFRERTQRGLPHGVAPYGYRREHAKEKLTIDEDAADVVRQIFRLRNTGSGPAAIARDLTARGFLSPSGRSAWPINTVCRILENPVYTGALACGGTVNDACHDPIVDAELWRRVQAFAAAPRRSARDKPRRSWLEGSIEHCCGQPMYLSSGVASRPAASFRCRYASRDRDVIGQPGCPYSPRAVNADRAETMVWDRVVAELARVRTPRVVIAEARRRFRALGSTFDAAHQEAESRRKRAQARRQRAEDLYLSGSRDRAWFDAEDARVGGELHEVERQIAALPHRPDTEATERAWQALHDLRAWLPAIETAEARGLALRSLGVAIIHPGGRPSGRGYTGLVGIRFADEFAEFFARDDT